jgi:membrane protein DedA with SNARE-associated domain
VSNRLFELFYVADIDYSWVAKFLSLLLLPAAHEDIAIILGGYLVVNQLMPVGIVVATIYVGMVASDFGLYLIGLGARHLPWLSRHAVNERARTFGGALQRNLLGLAALGRVVPGAVFVIMIGCGWTRVPWTRVMLASLFSSALYLPMMLYLVIVFGDALDDRVGLWTWPFLLGLIIALAFMRYRVFTFNEEHTRRGKAVSRSGPLRSRAAAAAPYRSLPVRLPAFMRSAGLSTRGAPAAASVMRVDGRSGVS